MSIKVTEKQKVNKRRVSCSGGKGSSTHPLVYLDIPPTKKSVTCPYCSKEFILED